MNKTDVNDSRSLTFKWTVCHSAYATTGLPITHEYYSAIIFVKYFVNKLWWDSFCSWEATRVVSCFLLAWMSFCLFVYTRLLLRLPMPSPSTAFRLFIYHFFIERPSALKAKWELRKIKFFKGFNLIKFSILVKVLSLSRFQLNSVLKLVAWTLKLPICLYILLVCPSA